MARKAKSMARKVAPDELRDQQFRVPVTKAEKARYERHAKDRGIPLTILVRVLLDGDIAEKKKGIAA